ncbi:hypothetical protein BS17DRAFT_135213 [Gyrodon lividus]|nr:hypothetical protein BS17DRAFT_135213 [Gyrodon lividus]
MDSGDASTPDSGSAPNDDKDPFVGRVFSYGRQLLHFTRNRLSPSAIRAFLCLGALGMCNLLFMEDLLTAVTNRKRKWEEIDIEDEEENA